MTCITALWFSTCLSARPITGFTRDYGWNCNFLLNTMYSFFKRKIHSVAQIGTASWTVLLTTTTGKEVTKRIAKYIAKAASTEAASTEAASAKTTVRLSIDTGVTKLVIGLTLLFVA